jgi:hypothetical protein
MNRIITSLFALLLASNIFAQADDRPENTGDNFSLEGALVLFKKSTSLEEFEKMLNEENNNVNNLDLNSDGNIDYVAVNDNQDGDAHAIVLSIYLSDKEQQDIAVIGIEKTGAETAMLQIEGDPDLYPENTIVEPKEEGNAYIAPQANLYELNTEAVANDHSVNFYSLQDGRAFVNVWFWPGVRFVYAPGYVAWRSPWRWGLYPKWWKPWRPHNFSNFYGRCAPNRIYFHRVSTRRVGIARGIYSPRRSRSTLIIHNNRKPSVIIKGHRGGRVKAVKIRRARGRRF